jgi:hypothetical protein
MKTYGGVEVQIQFFLTWALVGGEWSVTALLPPVKEPHTPLDRRLGAPQK